MNEAAGLLGLLLRSRRFATGDVIMKEMRSHHVKLLLLSDTIGENSRKKMLDKCAYYHVPYVYVDELILNQVLGRRNWKTIAVLDEGFAKKLHACLKG